LAWQTAHNCFCITGLVHAFISTDHRKETPEVTCSRKFSLERELKCSPAPLLAINMIMTKMQAKLKEARYNNYSKIAALEDQTDMVIVTFSFSLKLRCYI